MIPYYLDIPELILPFDVDDKPYVQHPADYMSPTGLGLGGNSFQYRVVPENWYESVKTYLQDTLTIPVGSLTLLNTMCNASSPWHSEGPGTFGRKCALNFMIAGDYERSYVQWATRGAVEDIVNNEKEPTWWEDENLEVLAEHRMTPGQATIYNTMHWHRVFNFTGWNRLVISAAIREDIEEVSNLYESGKLFK
tara:strand:+ start:609 stop:1190 length:582 start_codon:yes stop_codon:yes gene_type:complete